jgi:hypothetical protein
MIASIARIPHLSSLLGIAYLSSFPLLLGTILLLACTHWRNRVWELAFAFNATIKACTATRQPAPIDIGSGFEDGLFGTCTRYENFGKETYTLFADELAIRLQECTELFGQCGASSSQLPPYPRWPPA